MRDVDAGDLVLEVGDAERARLAAERLQQGVGIEPALVARPEAAAGEVAAIEPREIARQILGAEQLGLGAELML